jgi:hypothetical protein
VELIARTTCSLFDVDFLSPNMWRVYLADLQTGNKKGKQYDGRGSEERMQRVLRGPSEFKIQGGAILRPK